MEDIFVVRQQGGLTDDELRAALEQSLQGRNLRRVLIIPPDFTRFHSQAGKITNLYYHLLKARGVLVDILPALGTHAPVTKEQWQLMYGDIPYECMMIHDWRRDVLRLGEVPAEYVKQVTEGLWQDPVDVEINRRIMDPAYDLIISPGQVVPHEVVGMANHAKNLFVGVGGNGMINSSHRIGAVSGMERMRGREQTPVRKIFDYGMEHFLKDRPILIRKYGYRGRENILKAFQNPENQDLRTNMGAAAHLIHGSSDGRFSITYAVQNISQEEIRSVGFEAASYDAMRQKYDPSVLRPGPNVVNGEEIYFIPNPALGLWIDQTRFEKQTGKAGE